MNIRKSFNERPILSATVAIMVLGLGGSLIAWSELGRNRPPSVNMPGKAFFSDDDGQTWFIDDDSRIPPFDHNGRIACGVQLYKCGKGKPFVWLLERYDPTVRASLEKGMPPGSPPLPESQLARALEVKAPGAKEWVKGSDPGARAASHLLEPTCPDGSTENLHPVMPGEE